MRWLCIEGLIFVYQLIYINADASLDFVRVEIRDSRPEIFITNGLLPPNILMNNYMIRLNIRIVIGKVHRWKLFTQEGLAI